MSLMSHNLVEQTSDKTRKPKTRKKRQNGLGLGWKKKKYILLQQIIIPYPHKNVPSTLGYIHSEILQWFHDKVHHSYMDFRHMLFQLKKKLKTLKNDFTFDYKKRARYK